MASHTLRSSRSKGTLLVNIGGKAVRLESGKSVTVRCTVYPGQGGCGACVLNKRLTVERKAEMSVGEAR